MKTTTMQKVAWPMMIVASPNLIVIRAGRCSFSASVDRPVVSADCRATPVTMPGRAMGRITNRLTTDLPKKS